MTADNGKTCFVISPIDQPGTETRNRSDLILEHIIRPALMPLGYNVVRADEINKPGIITNQIISNIYEAELVVADLTERNPNVFYELAVRHVVRKPFIQIIQDGEPIPFDVSSTRVIHVDHKDLGKARQAEIDIREQAKELEDNPHDVENPISASLDIQRLQQSENIEQRSRADMLSALSEVRSGLSHLSDIPAKIDEIKVDVQSQAGGGRIRESSMPLRYAREIAIRSESVFGFIVLISTFQGRFPWIYEVGLEAHRRVALGDPAKARQTFDELIRLLEISSSVLPRSPISMNIVRDLEILFERLVQYYGYTSAPSDADDLPW